MTTFSHTQTIAHLIIMGIGIFVSLQSSFILFSLRKKHHDNTCLLFCLYILTVSICLITRLILTFLTPTIEESFVQLPPLDTVITYPAILMLTLYVIELIHPRWANWRRTLLLLSPWGLLTILLFEQLGFSNYHDMLNRCRVAFIMEELKKQPDQSIQELFYCAGYRSRATASRNFQLIAGCSPSEYIASFTNQPHF